MGSFNPRPCTRGDVGPDGTPIEAPSFNPRPCTRGDRAGWKWRRIRNLAGSMREGHGVASGVGVSGAYIMAQETQRL